VLLLLTIIFYSFYSVDQLCQYTVATAVEESSG
jgi:hypothetical protein